MTDLLHADPQAAVPCLRLWDVLVVPLQGDLTDAQATGLGRDVLAKIAARTCRALLIDASALWLVDSHLCALLADLARSARLMGVRTYLCGLRPDVALTLLAMDIGLEGVHTRLDLEQALLALGFGPHRSPSPRGTAERHERERPDHGTTPNRDDQF